jgi:hypothetical protein
MGFCVWNSSFELVLWNRHYCDIYNFPLGRIHSGGQGWREGWAQGSSAPRPASLVLGQILRHEPGESVLEILVPA